MKERDARLVGIQLGEKDHFGLVKVQVRGECRLSRRDVISNLFYCLGREEGRWRGGSRLSVNGPRGQRGSPWKFFG